MSANLEPLTQASPPPAAAVKPGRVQRKITELIHYRHLLQNLVLRDLKVRYKNSILGVLWTLLNPLLMMGVFGFVFTTAFNNDGIRQYPVFFLVGLIHWNLFSWALLNGTMSIVNNSALIKKVYFPREILPVAAVLSSLVNFGFSFLVLVIFLYVSGIGLTIHALWLIPLLLTQLLLTVGLSLLLGAINVFYRDVVMILDVVMLAWFFLTPVMYPFELFNSFDPIHIGAWSIEPARLMRWLNPMASLIDGYRTVLWGTQATSGPVSMDVSYLLRTLATALIVFVVGYLVFMRTQRWFGEKL